MKVLHSGIKSFLTLSFMILLAFSPMTIHAAQKPVPVIAGKSTFTTKYSRGKSFDLGAKTASTGTIKYSSSDRSVATVSSAGKVYAKGVGSCTITISVKETDKYAAAVKKVKVTLWKQPISIGYSSSYKKCVYYKRLRNLKLLASTRSNLLSVAASQLGYHESGSPRDLMGRTSKSEGNYTEYGRFYGYNGDAWCAIFANWVARQNGISYATMPKECAVARYYSFFYRKGLMNNWKSIRSGKYKPTKGDVIFFNHSVGGTTHHIGYVENVTYTSNKIYITTIEGNQKDAVRRVKMSLSRTSPYGKIRSFYIAGIAHPNY